MMHHHILLQVADQSNISFRSENLLLEGFQLSTQLLIMQRIIKKQILQIFTVHPYISFVHGYFYIFHADFSFRHTLAQFAHLCFLLLIFRNAMQI